MSKTITISNTGSRTYELSYRMPGETVQILKVYIYPYALNTEVSFPTENHYLEFKKQCAAFFAGNTPQLIEGKTSVNKIEKINAVVNEKAQETLDAEVNKITNQLSDISEQTTGKPVAFNTEKVSKTGKGNKNKGKI